MSAGQAPPRRRRPSPRRGDVQSLGGPWRRAAGLGAPRCCCSCWRRRWEAKRRRRSRGRRGSAGTSSAITTRAGRCTPGRRPGCPSPTTRCTSARPRVGGGRGRGCGAAGPGRGCARSALGAAERGGGGGSATSGGARGPGPCPSLSPAFPQPCLPSALPSPRRSAGPAGRARQPGERQGERRGRRAPAAPSRPPFVSCSPPPSHGFPRGPRFQKWRTSSGKRFTGCPGMLCACSAPETMNGLLS